MTSIHTLISGYAAAAAAAANLLSRGIKVNTVSLPNETTGLPISLQSTYVITLSLTNDIH